MPRGRWRRRLPVENRLVLVHSREALSALCLVHVRRFCAVSAVLTRLVHRAGPVDSRSSQQGIRLAPVFVVVVGELAPILDLADLIQFVEVVRLRLVLAVQLLETFQAGYGMTGDHAATVNFDVPRDSALGLASFAILVVIVVLVVFNDRLRVFEQVLECVLRLVRDVMVGLIDRVLIVFISA